MSDWLDTLQSELRAGRVAVRVVVATARGSAPREAGACMLVGEGAANFGTQFGTIGGGHLEWKAIGIARGMLQRGVPGQAQFDRLSLGATLGQCCGGVVELWFERFDAGDLAFIDQACVAVRGGDAVAISTVISSAGKSEASAGKPERALFNISSDQAMALGTDRAMLQRSPDGTTCLIERIDRAQTPLWIFGAGHVGSALVKVLADLPLRITWVDSREEEFTARLPSGLPGNVSALVSESPADEVRSAPAGAYFLVLTHSHDLDYEICRALLGKNDFAWTGLIGSKTKAAKFRSRFERQGVSRQQFDRITCPIGVDGIDSKLPAAIALAVAAQVLQAIESIKAMEARTTSRGVATPATPATSNATPGIR